MNDKLTSATKEYGILTGLFKDLYDVIWKAAEVGTDDTTVVETIHKLLDDAAEKIYIIYEFETDFDKETLLDELWRLAERNQEAYQVAINTVGITNELKKEGLF